MSEHALSPGRLLRPLPPALLAPVALVVLVAGAAYCLGYVGLSGGAAGWPGSLVWSACAFWPWLFLFEAVKRRESGAHAPVPPALLAAALVATGIVSIAAELLTDRLGGHASAPLALLLMRRLPPIGATLLLLLLARPTRAGRPPVAPLGERETLLRQAPAIRWIRAADNYVELHLGSGIVTLRLTMGQAEAMLAPLDFVRIHRSFIVARHEIDMFHRDAVRLRDGTELPVGPSFAARLGC